MPPLVTPPQRPARGERALERRQMVETQISRPDDGRQAVLDPRVLEAMRTVPRHAFVPESFGKYAYQDQPLLIGKEQTISQPYIVARMTELLGVEPGSRVLEIGTGSGYQAAVLSQLTASVFSIEILPELAARARRTLEKLGYDSIRCHVGDGSRGWPEEAPFDRILVTCATPMIPPPLWKQLKEGGFLVFPQGEPHSIQWLVVAEKAGNGECLARYVMHVAFVPLTTRSTDPPLIESNRSPNESP